MPFDQARLDDTRAWLKKVTQDLSSAQAVLAAESPVLEDVLFHSQQAVEKAIKAFLTWHDIPFGKTHDLRKLLELGYPADAGLASLLNDVEPLSKFAWMYRYPATVEEPRHDKTLRVFADARRLVTEILDRLPSEVRVLPLTK